MLRLRARLGHDCWRQLGVCAGRGEAGRLGSSAAAVFLGRLRLRPSPAASARMMAGAGAVSRIVAEAMAEVDAKMLALPTPPGSPLTSVATSLARRDVGRATNTDGLPRSGSCHSLSAAPDWRKMTTGVSRRCSSLTDLQTAAALSPATSGAALVESSPPSDHWEGEEWPGRPLRFCADLLPPPSAY